MPQCIIIRHFTVLSNTIRQNIIKKGLWKCTINYLRLIWRKDLFNKAVIPRNPVAVDLIRVSIDIPCKQFVINDWIMRSPSGLRTASIKLAWKYLPSVIRHEMDAFTSTLPEYETAFVVRGVGKMLGHSCEKITPFISCRTGSGLRPGHNGHFSGDWLSPSHENSPSMRGTKISRWDHHGKPLLM